MKQPREAEMKIGLDTLEEQPVSVESYGDKVSALLNLGDHPRNMPFAEIHKKMMSGKGEIFTRDRHISFKSNGGFTKLKEKETVNYSDVTGLEFNNASFWMEWKFSSSDDDFKIGLVFYGKVKGISPNDVFWYERDKFPERSGVFYRLISAVFPETGLLHELKADAVKRRLDDALDYFLGNRSLEDIGLEETLGNNLKPRYAAVQNAFGWYLAGTAASTDSTSDLWLDLFPHLNTIFAGMLEKLQEELLTVKGGVFTGEQQIYDAGEKFQRLSSIWYLRQIASLHFASKFLPEEENRPWPMKILAPRARLGMRNNRRTVNIKLPEPEVFQEAISRLRQ